LADARGRAVGFQARKLYEDDPLRAKYVNSPESDLFQKRAILYGLDRARGAISKQDRAIVVEGNTDVLALRQAGLEPVVASMGTALTEQQLTELSRLTRHLWLCFDGDAAVEAGLAPRRGAIVLGGSVSPKLLDAGQRLERDVLAACAAFPKLVPLLGEVSPEHFGSEGHRELQRCLVEGLEPGEELVPLYAE